MKTPESLSLFQPRIGLICLESTKRKSSYPNFDVVVIDHESDDEETRSLLAGTKDCRVIRYEGEFNFSRMNNLGAANADGDHFLFLNNDTELVTPDWIEAMVEHSQRDEVAAVGAKLVSPDGYVRHAGDVVGLGGIAGHAFDGIPVNDTGYLTGAGHTQLQLRYGSMYDGPPKGV